MNLDITITSSLKADSVIMKTRVTGATRSLPVMVREKVQAMMSMNGGVAQSERATGEFERYFIQPAFGLNKKVMHVSFIPRISLVDFTTFSNDIVSYPIEADPVVFIEPAVAGKVNLMDNHFFFIFQAGFSIPATETYFEYRPFQLSTGIGFRLGESTKQKS